MKSKVDKLVVNKVVPVPADLNKISDDMENDVVKNDASNAKIRYIEDKIPDITNIATNATLTAKINQVRKEIPRTTNLAITTSLNAKINEVKNKIPNTTNWAATSSLTAVENKKPNVGNLFKKLTITQKLVKWKI